MVQPAGQSANGVQTIPPLPDDSEKISATANIHCRPSELTFWMAAFGQGQFAKTVRELLTKEAIKRFKRPRKQVVWPPPNFNK